MEVAALIIHGAKQEMKVLHRGFTTAPDGVIVSEPTSIEERSLGTYHRQQ